MTDPGQPEKVRSIRPPACTCELDRYDLPGAPATPLVWLSDPALGIRLGVLPAAGGEMTSFQVRTGEAWREILHRALHYESWPCEASDERAPLLWPAVGQSFTQAQIRDWERTGTPPGPNRYQVGDTVYDIRPHGFVRGLPWRLDSSGATETSSYARCSLRSDARTLKTYPFNFELSVTYRVGAGKVVIQYEVVAGQNPRPMPFSIGNHMTFRIPLAGQSTFDKCTIRTPGSVILQQNPLCLLSGERTPVDLSNPTPLHRKELLDTVLGGFRRDQLWVELEDPGSLRLRISHREVCADEKPLTAEEDLLFVFWGDPARGFFCPEPWMGRPNSLNTGKGCIHLEAGQRFRWEVCMEAKVGT